MLEGPRAGLKWQRKRRGGKPFGRKRVPYYGGKARIAREKRLKILLAKGNKAKKCTKKTLAVRSTLRYQVRTEKRYHPESTAENQQASGLKET